MTPDGSRIFVQKIGTFGTIMFNSDFEQTLVLPTDNKLDMYLKAVTNNRLLYANKDNNEYVVEEYKMEAAFEKTMTLKPQGDRKWSSRIAVCVDSDSGKILVLDRTNMKTDLFSSTGTILICTQ